MDWVFWNLEPPALEPITLIGILVVSRKVHEHLFPDFIVTYNINKNMWRTYFLVLIPVTLLLFSRFVLLHICLVRDVFVFLPQDNVIYVAPPCDHGFTGTI